MAGETQYCTFYVDNLFFGVDVLQVQEVILYQQMSRVPLSPTSVRGLINLRGQIVTAIDLRKHLGLTPYGSDDMPMNVVVHSDGDTVSLLVDRIGDVLEVTDDTFEVAPDTVSGIARKVITGVHKLKGQLLLVLDVERAMNMLDRSDSQSEAA